MNSPLKRVGSFITNLNPLHPKMHCAKFGWNWPQWFLRNRFLYFINVYFHYFILSSHGKGQGPSFEQTWITFTKGCFVPSLVEIGSVVLEKKIFKFHQHIITFSKWKKEWASSHTPCFIIGWECCIQWMDIPSISNSEKKKWIKIICGYAHLHGMSFTTTKFQEILLSSFRGLALTICFSSIFHFGLISKFKKGDCFERKNGIKIFCGYAHLHITMSF